MNLRVHAVRRAFFLPSIVESGQMGLDPGLRFRFRRGGRVLVKGTAARNNYRQAGGDVPLTWFSVANAELSSSDGRVRYSVEGAGGRTSGSASSSDWEDGHVDTKGELAKRIIGRRPSGERDTDEDEESRSGRKRRGSFFARRRSYEDGEEDEVGYRDSRSASGSRRTGSRSGDWDDDDRYDRQRRRRSRDRDED